MSGRTFVRSREAKADLRVMAASLAHRLEGAATWAGTWRVIYRNWVRSDSYAFSEVH